MRAESTSDRTREAVLSVPPTDLPRSQALLLACFAAVYVIWGSTYLALRIAVETIPPFLLGGCRFLLAGGGLYAAARLQGSARPRLADWRQPAIAGLMMLTAGNGLVAWAEQRVASSTTALLIAAVPLWVVLLEWLRPGGDRPTPAQLGGIAVGGVGLALLVTPARGTTAATSPSGVLAVLASGLAWAAGTVYTRHAALARPQPQRPSSALVSAQQMLAAGAGLLIVSLVAGETTSGAFAHASARSITAFAYLTLFGSVVAFSAFGYLVRVSTPALVSTTAYVNPIVAVALGWIVLDERLAPRTLAGAAVTVGAVAIMTLGRRWR